MHIGHEGDHTHPHTHDHEHSHDHDSGSNPKEQLLALIRYMVSHNTAHTEELAGIAYQLEQAGELDACAGLREVLSDYTSGNKKLAKILAELEKS